MELVEVYRITYEGREDRLRGVILCKDQENGYQFIYKDENMEDVDVQSIMLKYDKYENYKDADKQLELANFPLIRDSDHIIPNARMKSSIRAKDGFLLKFCMFGVFYQDADVELPRPSDFSSPLTIDVVSRDGFRFLSVFYAVFENAVEAHVKVTFTKVTDPFDLYGVVSARTSAIDYPAYSSLIFCKRHDEKKHICRGDSVIIPLSRDIVAVPLEHQLILEFSLHGLECSLHKEDEEFSLHEEDEDNDKMAEEFLIFDAREDGTSTDSIRCSKGELKVEVTWRCIRES